MHPFPLVTRSWWRAHLPWCLVYHVGDFRDITVVYATAFPACFIHTFPPAAFCSPHTCLRVLVFHHAGASGPPHGSPPFPGNARSRVTIPPAPVPPSILTRRVCTNIIVARRPDDQPPWKDRCAACGAPPVYGNECLLWI